MNRIKNMIILFIILFLVTPVTASQNIDYKNVADGSSWTIGGGYYIRVEGVDYAGEQAFVSIWNNGEMLQEKLIKSGGNFEYLDSSGTVIISMKVSSIFRGMSGSVCRFSNIYLKYGEPGSGAVSTKTPTKTATSIMTSEPRETVDVDFGEGAMIQPGLSGPAAIVLLLLTAFVINRRQNR